MPSYPESVFDIATPEAAQQAAERLSGATELAVDLEADAMHAFRARLCFVQVASDTEVDLFDTLQPGVEARCLSSLLGDARVTKYLHAAMGDLQYLAEAGVRVEGLFDTHRAATLLGWPKVGLADLVREHAGVELTKAFQQADWSVRPLKEGMHAYLADDVRYLVEVGRWVRERCREADILEEVELDCARMAAEAVARPAEGAEWRPKLPRQGTTKGQIELAFAIARLLHQRRLQWAEAADVPMGRMLSNAAITEIALHPPGTIRELARLQGVRGPFVREHGEEVLTIVRTLLEQQLAGTLPPQETAVRREPVFKKREEALKAWRQEKAALRKVTPGVVLPNPLLESLVASPPPDLAALTQLPFFGEKRLRLYGAELVTLLAGVR